VNTPLVEIFPADAAHVTALEKFPVPATVAVQVDVAPVKIGVWQTTVTLAMAEAVVTATVAVPLFVPSSVLVAVTVTVCAVEGAVRLPVDEIVPAEVDQVTVLLKLPVPVTAAVQALVWPLSIDAGAQVTVTDVIVGWGAGGTGVGVGELPPQLTRNKVAAKGSCFKRLCVTVRRSFQYAFRRNMKLRMVLRLGKFQNETKERRVL
jgi:hypothetical protein